MSRNFHATRLQETARPHRRLREPSFTTGAFTLVELLVVIAIIGIVSALLMSALAGAQLQASRVQCVGNQKQLVFAWMIYSSDNNDQLVANGGDTERTSTNAHLWVYGGNHGSTDTLTNAQYLVGEKYALFAPILRNARVYKCPADRSTWPLWNSKGTRVTEMRSYAMNSFIGTTAVGIVEPLNNNPDFKNYTKASELNADRPVSRFVFIDVNPASICTPAFGMDMKLSSWIHYPSDLHQRFGVLAMADGHVESHRWVDSRTMLHLAGGSAYLPHGKISADNADLNWLAALTTSKK